MEADGDMTIHEPVMVEETMDLLDVKNFPDDTYVDATAGTGGHSREICRKLGSDGRLLGLDRDGESLQVAKDRLSRWEDKVDLYRVNFARLGELVEQEGITDLGGVLLDLGFSSAQLEKPDRGFSFKRDGPLDMRMDRRQKLTAGEILNEYSREELVELLKKYGEERFAGRIAGGIVERRKTDPIETTKELAELVKNSLPDGYVARSRRNPATKTFQALRIEVNDELENLSKGLEGCLRSLRPGGRLVVISYHSLEERITKRFMKEKEKECTCPPDLPVCRCDKRKEGEILTDGILTPDEEEVEKNPRSRSASLRALVKLDPGS